MQRFLWMHIENGICTERYATRKHAENYCILAIHIFQSANSLIEARSGTECLGTRANRVEVFDA